LFGYDFQVEYRQGKFNVVADVLSRHHEDELQVHALSTTIFEAYDTLRQELLIQPQAIQFRAQLLDQTAPPGWTDVDGILMFQGRAWLPGMLSLSMLTLRAMKEVRKPCINYMTLSIARMHDEESGILFTVVPHVRRIR
jgi:hypothetical protein